MWTTDGMRTGKGNQSTRRKPAPVPPRSLQIPHDLKWDEIQAIMVGPYSDTVY
jgi:hypothetical protein